MEQSMEGILHLNQILLSPKFHLDDRSTVGQAAHTSNSA
jgi:hypothetical protein